MSETDDELVAVSPPPKSAEQQEVDRLRFEIDMLTRGGVIEVAVRNPSVAEYMEHWEGRAEKAESGLTEAATRIASLTARVSELEQDRDSHQRKAIRALEVAKLYNGAVSECLTAGGVVIKDGKPAKWWDALITAQQAGGHLLSPPRPNPEDARSLIPKP